MVRSTVCFAALLLAVAPSAVVRAQAPDAGPAPSAACAQYLAAVASLARAGDGAPMPAQAEAAPKPRRKGLLGFAKKVAGVAAPMMLGGIGGGSMLGLMASQGAGLAAGAGGLGDAPSAVGVSAAEQARMVALARSVPPGGCGSVAATPLAAAATGEAPATPRPSARSPRR